MSHVISTCINSLFLKNPVIPSCIVRRYCKKFGLQFITYILQESSNSKKIYLDITYLLEKSTLNNAYLVSNNWDVGDVQEFQFVQTQKTVIHILWDRISCQVECPQMMHWVPGRGWRSGQFVTTQVEVAHVGQIGHGFGGYEG